MDSIYSKALEVLENEKEVSCVTLQRKLSIGYELAHNILEKMEEDGCVSAMDEKTFKRKVLITKK